MLNSVATLIALLVGGYIFRLLRNRKQGFLWAVCFYVIASICILILSMIGLLIAGSFAEADALKAIDKALAQSFLLALVGPPIGAWLIRLFTSKKDVAQ